jgi:uncharacterized protein (DUF2249 family)/hemerythrin-like domain-containing protein
MSDVVIANSQDDAIAAERVEQHHAEMAGALDALVQQLTSAAGGAGAVEARQRLVSWCRTELLPHAAAEESTLYAAARQLGVTRLLVEAMIDEHQVIAGLVDEVESAPDAVRTVAGARALQVLFETHLAKENDQLLPLLVSSPAHSVAGMLMGMHELLGAAEAPADPDLEATDDSGCGGRHTCACGESATAELPELDARGVPHAIRHATIFGALDAVSPGGGMVLVAPHDPLPLLRQLEQRAPDTFDVSYVERGPDAWRLRFLRRS